MIGFIEFLLIASSPPAEGLSHCMVLHPIFIIVPLVLLLILILVVILRLFFKDKVPEKALSTLSSTSREDSSSPPTEEKLAELIKNHAVLFEKVDPKYLPELKEFYLEANLCANKKTLKFFDPTIDDDNNYYRTFLESYYQVNFCRLRILAKKSETEALTNDELSKARNYRADAIYGITVLNNEPSKYWDLNQIGGKTLWRLTICSIFGTEVGTFKMCYLT